MRVGPTLALLALLAGCAAQADDSAEPGGSEESATRPHSAKENNDDTEEPTDTPEFEADFEEDESPTDPDDDPAPPDAEPQQCIDNDDPGSAENVAKSLPNTDDCDNDYKEVKGVMKGAVDVDFYRLSAQDEGVSWSHPAGCKLDTDFEAQTAGTELCVFARCKNSTANAVTGCQQGVMTTSEIGMKGCCAAAPGKAVPKWDCSGFTDDDSADFFLRVRQINGNQCVPYKVRYRY